MTNLTYRDGKVFSCLRNKHGVNLDNSYRLFIDGKERYVLGMTSTGGFEWISLTNSYSWLGITARDLRAAIVDAIKVMSSSGKTVKVVAIGDRIVELTVEYNEVGPTFFHLEESEHVFDLDDIVAGNYKAKNRYSPSDTSLQYILCHFKNKYYWIRDDESSYLFLEKDGHLTLFDAVKSAIDKGYKVVLEDQKV